MKATIFITALLTFAISLHAITTNTFSNESNFLAAVGGSATLESFESVTAANSRNSTSLTVGNLTVSSNPAFGVFNTSPNFFGTSATHGTNYIVSNIGGTTTFTFSQAISSFGINITDFGDNNTSSDVLQVSLDVDNTNIVIANAPRGDGNLLFFGVVTDGAFNSLTFSYGASEAVGFDEVYSVIAPTSGPSVPEPSIWLLSVIGFALLFTNKKRM